MKADRAGAGFGGQVATRVAIARLPIYGFNTDILRVTILAGRVSILVVA